MHSIMVLEYIKLIQLGSFSVFLELIQYFPHVLAHSFLHFHYHPEVIKCCLLQAFRIIILPVHTHRTTLRYVHRHIYNTSTAVGIFDLVTVYNFVVLGYSCFLKRTWYLVAVCLTLVLYFTLSNLHPLLCIHHISESNCGIASCKSSF